MYGNNQNSGHQNMQYSGHSQHHPGSNNYQQNYQTGYSQAAPHPQQYQGQEMVIGGNGQQYGQMAAPGPINMKQPASLIQPPALNVEETINTNSQFLPQRGNQMAISNNDNSEFDMYPQQ